MRFLGGRLIDMGGLRRLVGKVVRRRGPAPDPQLRRQQRIADAIRASGLFDADWYREQLDTPLPPGTDPVEHYVTVGSATDISPNPCFDTAWYRDSPLTPQKLDVAPFVHYVNRGAARGLPPHPMFDPEYYVEQQPAAADHPGGALGHYLEVGWRSGARPSADFDLASYRRAFGQETEAPLADFIKRTHRLMAETRGWEHLPRTSESFDHAAAEEFKARTLADYAALAEEPPLVSIVIPTKDRREGVLTAVRSVLDQTWTNWQLVVVDDGSTDGTAEALEPFLSDSRIELVRRERAGGVSVARNTGLARARGDYVAYLDSDNTWVPEFLEVMVAFVRTRGLRFGYAVSELMEDKEGGRRGYRALPFNREALRERNYIDCIVVLHERSLLDEVGMFDEQLRRNVDWDLLIRMSEATDFELAPFVATRYDVWEDRTDRITINEPLGYRHAVLGKHLVDWSAVAAGLDQRRPGSVSVVIHATGEAAPVAATVERLFAVTDAEDLEVLVIDAKTPDAEGHRLQWLAVQYPHLRVLRQTRALTPEVSRNVGAAAATGETLVFLLPDTWVEPGWLAPLTAALADGAAAAQPLVMAPDGTVWSAGVAFARGAHPHSLFRTFPADDPQVLRPRTPTALTSAMIAVRAADFAAVQGFDPLFVRDTDNPDLSLRLTRHTGRPLRYVPGSQVALTQYRKRQNREAAAAIATDNQELLTGRWQAEIRSDDTETWREAGYAVVGYDGAPPTHWGFDPSSCVSGPSVRCAGRSRSAPPTCPGARTGGTGTSPSGSRRRSSASARRWSSTPSGRGTGPPHASTTSPWCCAA